MSCEVHLITDPEEREQQLLPWVVAKRDHLVRVALPRRGPYRAMVEVQAFPPAAKVTLQGRSTPMAVEVDMQRAQYRCTLPDGGLVLVNDEAFSYPDDSWFNLPNDGE